MNKVFKVIWSEARNAYVVVSEIAKNHGSKSCSTKKLLTMLIATGVMTCASMAPAMADNPAPNDLNVTIGNGAHVSVWNGVTGQNINGDIAIGPNAHAWNGEHSYGSEGRIGSKEYLLDFGQGGVVGAENIFGYFYKYKVADGSKIAGSIAIGKNTIARTGSVMLGDHSYTGKLGDIEINPANPTNAMTYNDGIYSTTLGAGAYNSGSLAAVTGALSIASGSDTKNTGATIYGSMNSIESATSSNDYSGVASSVLGFANRTQNANAALIWGTGNEVTNSIEKVGINTNWNNVSVAEAQKKAIEAMQSSDYAGGSVMAIGGGNKADYAKYSQLTGVKNTVTGTEAKAAEYDFVNGYQNTVTNASDVTVIGRKNKVIADGNKVIGDNQKVSGKNNVIFGSADKVTETTVNNAVVLGHNAKVTSEGGIALGAGSVASTDKGKLGYGADGKTDATWQATKGAVSVGGNGATRQITNVAAGTADTDAVNVAQLKTAKTEVKAGANITSVDKTTGANGQDIYTINAKDTTYAAGNGITISGENNAISVKLKEGENNLDVTADGLALKKDLTVNSVKAGEFYMSNAGIGYGDKAYITSNGLNANSQKITNVAEGTADTDAVNVSQLKEATANANKGWKLSTENAITSPTNVKPGATVDFSGGDENITVSKEANEYATLVKVNLNRNLNVDSVNAGDYFMSAESGIGFGGDAYITQNGLNANNKVISNVAEGVNNTDAVNVGQLNSAVAESGWNLATNGVVTSDLSKIKNNAIVNFEGDENIGVSKETVNGINTVKVELNNNIAVDTVKAGDYFMSAGVGIGVGGEAYITQSGLNANGKVISNVAAGTADTDAVNVGQLNSAVANSGWQLATNGVVTSDLSEIKNNGIVNFDGDENIGVSKETVNGINTVKVELNNNIAVDTVKAGDYFMSAGVGIGVGGEAYITQSGLNANGKVISNVAAGTADTDAVNVGQLNSAVANSGWQLATNGVVTSDLSEIKNNGIVNFDGDENIGVSKETVDGITTVKVELGKDLKDIESISNGSAKIELDNHTGITLINNRVGIDQNGRISGVANGINDTDAVNVGQLNSAVANSGWKLATNGVLTEAKDVKSGEYVDFSGDQNISVSSDVKDGVKTVKVDLSKDLRDIESISNGDSRINLNADSISISNGNKSFAITNSGIGMSYITADYSAKSIMLGENGTTISGGLNVAGSQITGVATGVADTDAVNVGQLKEAVEAGNTDTHIKVGEYGVGADNKVNMDVVDKNGNNVGTVTIKDVAKASDVGDVNNIASDIKNKEGKTTVVDAVNNLNNKVGDLQYSKVEKGDIADGDSTTTAIGKLDQKLTDVAATAAKHTTVTQGDNITVSDVGPNADGGKEYKVALNKDINLDSVTTGQTVMNKDGLKVGENVSVTENGLKVGDKVSVTEKAVTAGKTSISDEGVKVGDKTYISADGLNANNNKITNVANGKVEKDSKDAINGGQLFETENKIKNRIDGVENQVISNTNRINQLGNRVNKVGAGAAALAALHPMDFDPDDKLTFSAGYGNYGGENAAAIGAYYRPDEKVMFSVGGTVGNGENMVNAGVSFSLDRTNHVSNSRTAMAREILDLRAEVTELKAMVAKGGLGSIAEDKMKIFPDVAENHWAYEYVGKLAAAGIIEGYPDGNFSGDRMMSRYEFAAMLYRAMQKGAQLDSKIINEFAPEMGRIRVDRISGEDGDRDKIERVRVNAVKGERDHYGNKIAKAEAKAK